VVVRPENISLKLDLDNASERKRLAKAPVVKVGALYLKPELIIKMIFT
jgi:hypothetical protein